MHVCVDMNILFICHYITLRQNVSSNCSCQFNTRKLVVKVVIHVF